jgi:hypothetical protein
MALPVYTLPVTTILAGIMVPMIIILLLVVIIIRQYVWGKEGFMFAKARRKGLPMLSNEAVGSGDAEFIIGEKDENGDIFFKDETHGIKLDPRRLKGEFLPARYFKGLLIYHYGDTSPMPLSAGTAMAYQKEIDLLGQPKYATIQFLGDKRVIELLSTPRDKREKSVRNFLDALKPRIEVSPKIGIEECAALVEEVRENRRWKFLWPMTDEELVLVFLSSDDRVKDLIKEIVGARQDTFLIKDKDGDILIPFESVTKKMLELKAEFQEIPMPPQMVLDTVAMLEEEASRTSIESGFFAYYLAHLRNPYHYTAQHQAAAKLNYDRKAFKKYAEGFMNSHLRYMGYCAIIGISGVVMVVAFKMMT